ncbi:MAG: sec-independent protein translocase protein TatC [Candidatus Poseidoniaceae archaeon]|jgi:sec-independent protein translocase protein TatC
MAEAEGLVNAVDELLDSPGGEILVSFQLYLRKRVKMLAVVFGIGVMATFPLTKNFIAWLIDPTRLPADVNIIVITPVEFILLQVRLAAHVGLLCIVIVFLLEGSFQASKNLALRQRLAELEIQPPRPNKTLLATLCFTILLLMGGIYYAWNWLIPMLLEYLTTDAQTAGLSTEWRLTSYIGFIANLAIASAIGFQAPLVTLLVLRMKIVRRTTVRSYRRHIWFGAFLLGAFLSPPDPLSLFLVAMPVVILFEVALMIDALSRQETASSS